MLQGVYTLPSHLAAKTVEIFIVLLVRNSGILANNSIVLLWGRTWLHMLDQTSCFWSFGSVGCMETHYYWWSGLDRGIQAIIKHNKRKDTTTNTTTYASPTQNERHTRRGRAWLAAPRSKMLVSVYFWRAFQSVVFGFDVFPNHLATNTI